ncbi:MAG: hypothetical protein IKK91_01390 [Ruminococcus sp.]|nr:hypothetical protein [Ruminococcus sp.]
MDENNSPVIFCIMKEEETRYYRNDDMSLNDLIQRYSECKRPFIELGETSQRIDTIQFVELEQTLGTTSIEIVPDENRVTVYENKGNDVYENELGNEFEEYKLSELLEQLEKIEIAPESEKSTITVDEDDLIAFAKKIERNNSEDKNFAVKIDDYLSGKLPPNEVLRIGTTPNCIRATGAKAIPLVITQSVLANSMENIEASKTASIKHSEQHDIQVDVIKSLPKLMRNPIMIIKGKLPDTIVLLSEAKNKEGQNIVVPMILDVKGQNGRVNRVTTIHGKKNLENYLNKVIASSSIMAINKTKADKLFSDIGIQSPKSTTIICFDNSISYSMHNVKIPEQNLQINKEKTDMLADTGVQFSQSIGDTVIRSYDSISPSTEKVNSSEKNIIEKLLAEGKAEFNDDGSFKINNDYYRALPREDRTIEVVPVQHAAEIMQQLADKGIEFSAVSRKNEKAAITVHIEHKSDLTSAAEKAVKGQIQKNQPTVSKTASKEIINPEYFKQLKSSERHIQRLPSGDADRIIAFLESKGIKFSAVKGEKLTSITVHKDDRAAIGQAVHENNKTAAKEYINSDYFKSLPPEQRVYSQTADLSTAQSMMSALDSEAVQYSAVIDNEKSNARITIAKEDIPKAQKTGFLFSRQSQKAFTEQAKSQNNEREATRVSEHKKENHTI